MRILSFINRLLKGERHAGEAEECVLGRNGRERRILYSIPSAIKRAVSDCRGIGMLGKACADERGRASREMSEDPIRAESRCLIAAARHCGCLLVLQGD